MRPWSLRLCAQDANKFQSVGTVAPSRLSSSAVDVYIVQGMDPVIGQYGLKIRQFVAAGGGLLISAQAYKQYSGPIADHPANQVLSEPAALRALILSLQM